MRISNRLQLIFNNLILGKDVWDFCCDHGYLGGAAYKTQKFADIYFVDQVSSIIDKVQTRFNTYVFDNKNTSKAHFILQSGQYISMPIRGTACITGVGAIVIYDILNGLAQNQFLQAQRLILGPHRHVEKLSAMIENNKIFNSYQLTAKIEILEKGRNRVIFIYDLIPTVNTIIQKVCFAKLITT